MADQQQWQALYAFSLRTGIDLSKTTSVGMGVDLAATSCTNTGLVRGVATQHFVATSSLCTGFVDAEGDTFFALPLTNRPAWEQGQEQIEADKAIGESAPTAGTGYNFLRGITGPTGSIEFQATPRGMIPFLWGLCQRGASANAGSNNETLTFELPPASAPTPEVFISALRRFSSDSADSQVLSDSVVTSFGFSSSEGEALQLSVDMMGRFLDNDFQAAEVTTASGASDMAHVAPDLDFIEENPLLHQNMDFIMQTGSDEFAVVELSSFDLSVTAEFIPKRYNSRFPIRYAIGGYTVEGSFTIPWGASYAGGNTILEDLASTADAEAVDVTTTALDFMWKATRLTLGDTYVIGTGSGGLTEASVGPRLLALNETRIAVGAVIQSVTVEGDDESVLNASFIGVNIREGNATTQPAFGVYTRLDNGSNGYGIP